MTTDPAQMLHLQLTRFAVRVYSEGKYAARILKNKGHQVYATFAGKPSGESEAIELIQECDSTDIFLEVGTYVLKIEVYRYASKSTTAQLYGTALYQPVNLVPGSQSTVSLESTSIMSSASLGNVYLTCRFPAVITTSTDFDLTLNNASKIEVLQNLLVLRDGIAALANSSLEPTSGMISGALCEAILQYMRMRLGQPDGMNALIPTYDAPNPAKDTVNFLNEQVLYLREHSPEDGTEVWKCTWRMSAQQLCTKAARSLMIVFGIIDAYAELTYGLLQGWSEEAFHELIRLQRDLLQLRAGLMHAQDPGSVDSLHEYTSGNGFIHSLAVKAVKYYVRSELTGSFVGPYMDILLCLRYKLAVQVMDYWKANIGSRYATIDDGARYRSAARCLMTCIAQRTRLLPSDLAMPLQDMICDDTHEGMEGRMRSPAEQNEGGSAVITSTVIFHPVLSTHTRIAVKSIREEYTEKTRHGFYREIIAGWTLSHPRLLPVLGVSPTLDGRFTIICPWIDNGNIHDYATKLVSCRDSAGFQFWVNIRLKQIAEGLTYIHGEYMAHGDLRGKNILVTADENVIIADFGLTVYVESSNEALRSTCRGNPRWTAPELASDSANQSVRPTYAADIYSFAMVCFELYTQDIPWGRGVKELTRENEVALGRHPPRPASLVNDDLWAVVKRCCALNPVQRGTAQQLLDDMGRIAPENAGVPTERLGLGKRVGLAA